MSEYVAVAIAMLLARAGGPRFVRMSSKLVGRSGRVYVRNKVLQAHPLKSELNVYLAQYVLRSILNSQNPGKLVTGWVMNGSSCEDRPFVLKPVSQSIFELFEELKHEFGNSCRIRTHID